MLSIGPDSVSQKIFPKYCTYFSQVLDQWPQVVHNVTASKLKSESITVTATRPAEIQQLCGVHGTIMPSQQYEITMNLYNHY